MRSSGYRLMVIYEWLFTGHFVPSKTHWRELLCSYLRDPSGYFQLSGVNSDDMVT